MKEGREEVAEVAREVEKFFEEVEVEEAEDEEVGVKEVEEVEVEDDEEIKREIKTRKATEIDRQDTARQRRLVVEWFGRCGLRMALELVKGGPGGRSTVSCK